MTSAGSIRFSVGYTFSDRDHIERKVVDLLIDEALDRETCSLDVAEDGGRTLCKVGEMVGLTRERARQIEEEVARKLMDSGLVEHV